VKHIKKYNEESIWNAFKVGKSRLYDKSRNLKKRSPNTCERIRSKESYRKKLFHLIDKIYKDDNERKRIERINNEINPSADLL